MSGQVTVHSTTSSDLCKPAKHLVRKKRTSRNCGTFSCWWLVLLVAVSCAVSSSTHTGSTDDQLVDRICTSQKKVVEFFSKIKLAKDESDMFCGKNASRCADVCKSDPGDLTINFTEFRFHAEFAVENAHLLSSLIADMRPVNTIWPKGDDSFINHRCNQLETTNFFREGNILFATRARSSALTDNIFAVGGCLGNGVYTGSECFYFPRNLSIDEGENGHHISTLHRVSDDADAPAWYETAKEFLQNSSIQKTDAWLGGECRRLCPRGNLTLLESAESCEIPDDVVCPVHTRYTDSLWVNPYFDCDLGFTWMVTYAAPVAVYHNKTVHYLGMAGIDIDLGRIQISQCSANIANFTGANVFADTNMCDLATSQCQTVIDTNDFKLRDGYYVCKCKEGFYYPHSNNSESISGFQLSERVHNLSASSCEAGIRAELQYFKCEKCPNRCRTCTSSQDDCRYKTKLAIVLPFHIVNGLAVVLIVALLIYVIVKRKEAPIRSASWQFLVVILSGCLLAFAGLFGESQASKVTCIMFHWTVEVGFALSYGSILLKSWRIEQIFSNKAMIKPRGKTRLKNNDLALYLVVFVLLFCIVLSIATSADLLAVEEDKEIIDHQPYYFDRCNDKSFKYFTLAVHLTVVLFNSFLCFKLRRVLNDYAESREISIIVYLSSLIEILAFVGKAVLETTPDIQYAVRSLEVFFQFGVMAAVLYLPKVRRVEWPTKEELTLSKATTAQMRLMRSTSATALRRRGTVSLDSVHRDSVLDWAQQHPDSALGHAFSMKGGERRRLASEYSAYGSKPSLRGLNGYMGSSDFSLPRKSTGSGDGRPMRTYRSQSLALSSGGSFLSPRDFPRSSGVSSSVGRSSIGSFGSISEASENPPISPLCPLSPTSITTNEDVIVFPACTSSAGLSSLTTNSFELERRHSTPANVGVCSSKSSGPAVIVTTQMKTMATSPTSRYSDVQEVDESELVLPSVKITVTGTQDMEEAIV
ncbi:uncharacterized protein LOC135808584 [Sycon ciliatum]|uniref:uncharacterized protein LOC135808584 n=1 Tax=Sycon ciliatum TaxID=27933 RepID=UPI0031F70541